MSTFYPSIYDNAYKYNTLQSNSIVITTETGFADVPSANNTVLVCNADGNWVTSSLNNFATSTDITNIQNSINNLSTYDDILQQSISNNLIAINTLQTNLTNNYFTKTEITEGLSNYVNISTFDEFGQAVSDGFYSLSNEISIINDDIDILNNNVQILTEDIIHMQDTFYHFVPVDTIFGSDILLEGIWKLYGTVTLYISDITKMTPKVNTLTETEWIAALPVFKIEFFEERPEDNVFFTTAFEAKIESNRPLITIPVNAIITTSTKYSYAICSNIDLPEPNDINIMPHDINIYKYDLYLERISGYKTIETGPLE